MLSNLVSDSANIFMLFVSTNCCSSSVLFPAVMLLMLTCAMVRFCCECGCSRGPGFVSTPLIISMVCMSWNVPSLVHCMFDVASKVRV